MPLGRSLIQFNSPFQRKASATPLFRNCPPFLLKFTPAPPLSSLSSSSMDTPPQGYRRNVGICLVNPSKKVRFFQFLLSILSVLLVLGFLMIVFFCFFYGRFSLLRDLIYQMLGKCPRLYLLFNIVEFFIFVRIRISHVCLGFLNSGVVVRWIVRICSYNWVC